MHSCRDYWRLVVWCLLWCCAARGLAAPANDQYTVAADHYTQARWPLAVEEFETFLREFPDDPLARPARFFLGESLTQLQRYADARQQFLTFLELAPYHDYSRRARFRAAEAAFLLGEHAAAAQEFETLASANSPDELTPYVLAYQGELALAAQRLDDAERHYRQAITQFPNGPLRSETRFGLARVLELRQEYVEALRFYQFLAESTTGDLLDDANLRAGILLYKLNRHSEATRQLAIFDQKLALSPLRDEARYWLGLAVHASGNPADAAKIFAAARLPADHPLTPALHFAWAESLSAAGDALAAARRYDQVQRDWPTSEWADDALRALIDLAFQQQDEGAWPGYLARFRETFPDSPHGAHVARLAGRWALKSRRYEEAMVEFGNLVARAESDSPAAATDRYYLAVALLGGGRAAEALDRLEAIEVSDSDAVLVRSVLAARASALVSLGRYDQALGPLTDYLAAQPYGPEAPACRAKLVICHAELGHFTTARQAWHELRDADEASEVFLPTTLYVAELAARMGETDFARELYTLLGEEGRPAEYVHKALIGLGKLALEAGDAEQAAQWFQQLRDRSDDGRSAIQSGMLHAKALEAAGHFEAALEGYLAAAEPGQTDLSVTAAFEAARLQQQLGRPGAAADLLQRLANEHPDFTQLDAVLYQLGWALWDIHETARAVGAFERLTTEFPQSRYWADAMYRLAEHAVQAKEPELAQQRLTALLARKLPAPLLGHALYLQGQLDVAMGNWERVADTMDRAAQEATNPELRRAATYWAAEARYRLADFEAADVRLASLTRDEAPVAPSTWLPMVPLRRAQILAQRGEWAAALQLAETIARDYPEFRQQYEADYLIGRCLSSLARFSEAREALLRVIRSADGRQTETAAMAQWLIGESYFHQKQYADASKAYHRVVSLYPYPRWKAAALLQAAKCHELLGQRQEAARLYNQLLRDHSETEFAAEARQRLPAAERHATSQTGGET